MEAAKRLDVHAEFVTQRRYVKYTNAYLNKLRRKIEKEHREKLDVTVDEPVSKDKSGIVTGEQGFERSFDKIEKIVEKEAWEENSEIELRSNDESKRVSKD